MKLEDTILIEDFRYLSRKITGFSNSTIFITGGTGLIGSQIIKALLYRNRIMDSNTKIVALVRNKEKAEDIYSDLDSFEKENLKFVYGDIREKIDVDDNVDYIIHGANATSSKYFVSSPVETIETIYLGTRNILEFAKNNKVKSVVYLSSMEVFGATNINKTDIYENDLGYIDILNIRSSYSEGKRIAETLCASYASQYGINVKIARLAQTFGPGIGKDDNRIFAQIARCVINKQNIVLHTTGESVGNYCYMRDSILAILMLLIKGEKGEAYTISNESISIKDMAFMAAEKIAENKISVIFDIPEDRLKYGYAPDTKMKLNSSKMKSLGWKPEIGIEESYRRMIKSMGDHIND